jgi:hypothetical protein
LTGDPAENAEKIWPDLMGAAFSQRMTGLASQAQQFAPPGIVDCRRYLRQVVPIGLRATPGCKRNERKHKKESEILSLQTRPRPRRKTDPDPHAKPNLTPTQTVRNADANPTLTQM